MTGVETYIGSKAVLWSRPGAVNNCKSINYNQHNYIAMQKPQFCAPLGVQPGPCCPGYVPPCMEVEEQICPYTIICDSGNTSIDGFSNIEEEW